MAEIFFSLFVLMLIRITERTRVRRNRRLIEASVPWPIIIERMRRTSRPIHELLLT